MKYLITSGGTKVKIDDVRYIGNFASGRYGVSLAEAIDGENEENSLVFFTGKGNDISEFENFAHPTRIVEYEDYFEYLKVKDLIIEEAPDVIISSAAVSDFICDKIDGKISSSHDTLTIILRKSEKVIASFRELAPNAIIVGFKLMVSPTPQEKKDAIAKLFHCGVNFVVYNDLTELRKGHSKRYMYDSMGRVKEIYNPKDIIKAIEQYKSDSQLGDSSEYFGGN